MNIYKPVIFLIPAIALVLAVLFFILLMNKVEEKSDFKRLTFIILVLAYLINVTWELVQMPLYKNASYTIQHIAFCALASVADAIMVFLLYFGFAFIYKDPFWIRNFKLYRTIILIIAGGAGAILAEVRHLSLGTWAYASAMPIIPGVDVGLSPVLQFMFLPAGIFYFSFLLIQRTKQSDYNHIL